MDSNHHVACFRGRWATHYPTRQRKQSAREDSNLRPRGSKPLTLTRLRYSPRKWWRWPPERLARRRASEMKRPRNRNTMTGRRTIRTRAPRLANRPPPPFFGGGECESNTRRAAYETAALAAELSRHIECAHEE